MVQPPHNTAFDSALRLIITEATEQTGILTLVRMGDDPGRDRMSLLIKAVQIAFEGLRGERQIERLLAASLFNLAFHIQSQLSAKQPSSSWPPELLGSEKIDLYLAVESIFEDHQIW